MNKRTKIEELAQQAIREATAEGFSDNVYRSEGYLMSVSKAFADKFAELILEEVANVICECDPSSKLILHEPYRTILRAIEDKMDEHEQDT